MVRLYPSRLTGAVGGVRSADDTAVHFRYGSWPALSILQRSREDTDRGGAQEPHGEIVVRSGAGSSETVGVEAVASDSGVAVDVRFDPAVPELRITTPRVSRHPGPGPSARVRIRVVVSIPGQSRLRLLRVNSDIFSVHVLGGLFAASEADGPQGAVVDIRSTSGNLNIRDSADRDLGPVGDRAVAMHTTSGNIHADALVGSEARFNSTSGNMDLRLLPGLAPRFLDLSGTRSVLETITTSGVTRMTLLDPVWVTASSIPPALSMLESSHTSTSGALRLVYPSSWEGRLSSIATTGNIDIRGRDFHASRTSYFTEGQKGNGCSHIVIRTTSADQDIILGEE